MTTFEQCERTKSAELNVLRALLYGLNARNGTATTADERLRATLSVQLALDDRAPVIIDTHTLPQLANIVSEAPTHQLSYGPDLAAASETLATMQRQESA